jgi:hypothetical protein
MKKIILPLLFPLFMFSQECYTVKEVTSSAQIEEMNQKRITFGIKQMAEELISENYNICQEGTPVIIDVYSIEAPSKGMSLGPFAKKKKQTIVKLKILLGNKELYGEGLAEISTQSMFLDLNDENLPFNKTSFSSSIKKALESALN